MVASKGKRLGAFLIDVVIVSVFSGVVVTALFAAASQADEGVAIATIILGASSALALVFAYKFVLELTPWRATFGKKALGIRIVAADGTEAGAGAIIWREILYAVFSGLSLVNLVFVIMLAVDDDARGWHDHLAGTKVVEA